VIWWSVQSAGECGPLTLLCPHRRLRQSRGDLSDSEDLGARVIGHCFGALTDLSNDIKSRDPTIFPVFDVELAVPVGDPSNREIRAYAWPAWSHQSYDHRSPPDLVYRRLIGPSCKAVGYPCACSNRHPFLYSYIDRSRQLATKSRRTVPGGT